jgi:hypothetical protein
MSEDKLVKALIALRDALQTAANEINNIILSMAPPEAEVKPTPTPTPTPQPTSAAPKFDPASLFPEDLRQLLTFEETKEGWKITPRQYLGAENFAKIAQIVRENGGEYVSSGKKSHFKLPRR